MKITVSYEVEVDLDGIVRWGHEPNAAAALLMTLNYQRDVALESMNGQTFMNVNPDSVKAYIDLNKQ